MTSEELRDQLLARADVLSRTADNLNREAELLRALAVPDAPAIDPFGEEVHTFMRLPEKEGGGWGIRSINRFPKPGEKVTVKKKDGSTRSAYVGAVIDRKANWQVSKSGRQPVQEALGIKPEPVRDEDIPF